MTPSACTLSRPAARAAALAVAAVLLLGPPPAFTQQTAPAAEAAGAPVADPADVESIDAIVATLYDVISGPVGEVRDWDRFRSLFLEGARLTPAATTPDGRVQHRVLTPEDYIELAGPQLVEAGFHEREVGRSLERFGNIAHAFSAYEGRRGEDGEPFVRGINSIQLLHDGERWWVANITWSPETPDDPVPERYLESDGAGPGR